MVLPHPEPDQSSPEEDDGEKQRQQDTDTAKEIADKLILSFKEIFKDEKVKWPDSGPHKGKLW